MICTPVVSFVYHYIYFSGMLNWEESMSTEGEVLLEGLENPGGGNKTH